MSCRDQYNNLLIKKKEEEKKDFTLILHFYSDASMFVFFNDIGLN